MKKITLENASFGLFTDLPPIRENGEEKEDDRSNAMFTELANSLLNEFTPLCKDAFTLEIREFECGEDEPHSYARIALLDDKGHDAVVGTRKNQYFVWMQRSTMPPETGTTLIKITWVSWLFGYLCIF